ncbi:MAG: cell division protein FtsA [Bacteroidetes bacterium]|uniref:Cell division protein FtsA n=1 Tax=Candidatus Cryptobacteroides merdavium TaxID=2840769 RepID=A0A9D9EGD8_9BACT|nr:cell division protein FtsA [Candidatus Cryptobacteroides merdavium]
MEGRHIVAIDLGTSKTALTVAEINGDDVQIVYYRKVPSTGIRYSYVLNPKNVADTAGKLVEDAEKTLKIKISSAVVGMPRYYIREVVGEGKFDDMDPEECITEEDVNCLKQSALDEYPIEDPKNEELYGAIAQSFSSGDEIGLTENDIVGVSGDVFSGNFNIYIGKKKYLQNIDVAFKRLGIKAVKKFFTPEPTGKAILTKSEMDNGVALVDIGAGVTSVSVYYKDILRHFASIPFGGNAVTADIKSECMITEELAEHIKKRFGGCMPDKLLNLSEKTLHIRSGSEVPDTQIPVKFLSEIITARMKEIIEAVLYEIQMSGFADCLKSGIVITGGGARLMNCGNYFKELSGYDTKAGRPRPLFSASGCEDFLESDAAVSAGLVLAAKNAHIPDCLNEDSPDEEPLKQEQQEPEQPQQAATDEGKRTETEKKDTETSGNTAQSQKQAQTAAPQSVPADKPKRKKKGKWTTIKESLGDLFSGMYEDVGKEDV